MSLVTADLEVLRRRCSALVVTPADAGWDAARQARNPAVDQQPVATRWE